MRDYESINVSDEFIDLCEAQLNLLFHNYLVQESAIYLTQTYQEKPKLIPILIYPNSTQKSSIQLLPSFESNLVDETITDKFDDISEAKIFSDDQNNPEKPYQLVLPLIYQDIVFGLLAMKRKHQPWQSHEIIEIKEVTQTIAIARLMEEKQQILESKYNNLQQLQLSHYQNLDDFLHQLKNPLTAIRTFAKLLLKNILVDSPNYNASKSIVRESDRLQQLIKDFQQQPEEEISTSILPSAKSTSFFLTENIESLTPIDILDVAFPILESIELLAKAKNIRVYRQINPSLPLILSNQKALTEIINNILENAIKYTPKNGYILVEIDLDEQDNIFVKITDTGYGIPPEEQPYIFTRNYRGSQQQGGIEGTGLGLAIVKELADKINLKISLISPYLWKKNQAYNGTQFCLNFPQNN